MPSLKPWQQRKDQPSVEDELNSKWAPGVPIDDRHKEVNIHQPDEAIKNEAETRQNTVTANEEQEEESDHDEDTSDDIKGIGDQLEEAVIDESYDYSDDADTTDAVYGEEEIKVEDVPLDEEEQETHVDAVEMFPLSDSEEELRSEHDSEIEEEEYNDKSQEEFSDESHNMSETESL